MITTISKWGNSCGIRLPKTLLETIHWSDNEQVDISIENNSIIIKKNVVSKRKNINELFENYNDAYQSEDITWGEPQGEEIW